MALINNKFLQIIKILIKLIKRNNKKVEYLVKVELFIKVNFKIIIRSEMNNNYLIKQLIILIFQISHLYLAIMAEPILYRMLQIVKREKLKIKTKIIYFNNK